MSVFRASRTNEMERLKSELGKAKIRESALRGTIRDLQRELDQKFSRYPIEMNPKVQFLLEVLASVLAVLQQYQSRKLSSNEAISLIAASLRSILKANKNLKRQENDFLSELDGVNENDDLPFELQISFRKMEECIKKINETAERINRHF